MIKSSLGVAQKQVIKAFGEWNAVNTKYRDECQKYISSGWIESGQPITEPQKSLKMGDVKKFKDLSKEIDIKKKALDKVIETLYKG
jgi:hypothetical protein